MTLARRTPSGVVVVTDRRQATAPLPRVVAAAVAGGARWVLLREKDLPRPERVALATRLRAVLAPVDGTLIVAGADPLDPAASEPLDPAAPEPLDPPSARRPVDGYAVHLAATDSEVRAVVEPGGAVVGRSCHSAAELERLTVEDYLTVSPVFVSRSKPGYGPPLGLAGLAELCRRTNRPVLALGGVETRRRAAACVAAGAAGVAVMGAVMRAADPAAAVAGFTDAVGGFTAPQSAGRAGAGRA